MMKKLLSHILLLMLGLSQLNAQELDDFEFSAGLNSSYLSNSQLATFMANYNKVNFTDGEEQFGSFRSFSGYEVGMRWVYLTMHYGQHFARQRRELGGNFERSFALTNSYVNVLGTFPVLKKKVYCSIGLNAYTSKLRASMFYPNGKESLGKEYALNGTYKGRALNWVLRADFQVYRSGKNKIMVFVEGTAPVAGTASKLGDFNAAKSALGTANNGLTTLEIEAAYAGIIFGVNYHFLKRG